MTATLEKTEVTEAKKPPVAKIRIGSLTASIWEQVTKKGRFFTVSFERSYKDAQDQWANAYTFGSQDLLTLRKLADLAHTKILELQGGDSE